MRSPFPMRSEPEIRLSFQCGVSLKPKRRMLRSNDATYGELRTADVSRNGRVSDEQSAYPAVSRRAGIGLHAHRTGIEAPAVPPAEQRAKGDREALSGQSHGLEPGSTHALDTTLDEDAPRRAQAGATAQFPLALHGCRHRHAGRDRRAASPSLPPPRPSPLPP